MPFTTLIIASELRLHLEDPDWAVVDCRFSLDDPNYVILDARSALHFRGEVEPIDSVARHVPGAPSVPCEGNVSPDGKFLPPGILCRRFDKFIKSVPTENVICYCGSGVTAAHNLFTIAYAGLGMGRLYAGSWSDWITDSTRPIAKGTE